jgi:hypothetical protein
MPATAHVQIRLFQSGDRSQVLALAARLTDGVAPWRDPAAVRRAARNWVQTSVNTAAEPGHAVYVAVASDRVVGVVSIREQPTSPGKPTPTSANSPSHPAWNDAASPPP